MNRLRNPNEHNRRELNLTGIGNLIYSIIERFASNYTAVGSDSRKATIMRKIRFILTLSCGNGTCTLSSKIRRRKKWPSHRLLLVKCFRRSGEKFFSGNKLGLKLFRATQKIVSNIIINIS